MVTRKKNKQRLDIPNLMTKQCSFFLMRSQSLTGPQHMQLNYLYGWVRETLSILVLVLIVNYLYDIMNEKSKPPLRRDRSTSDEALDLSMTDFLSGPAKLSPEKSKSFSDK